MSISFTEFLEALVRTGKWRVSGKFLGKCSTKLRHGKKIFAMLKNHYLLMCLERKSHISRYQSLKLY